MAANLDSYGLPAFGGEQHPKPSVVVMAYTSHSKHTSVEPPTFVVVGDQDSIAPAAVTERRVAALPAEGTTVEYRKYKDLDADCSSYYC